MFVNVVQWTLQLTFKTLLSLGLKHFLLVNLFFLNLVLTLTTHQTTGYDWWTPNTAHHHKYTVPTVERVVAASCFYKATDNMVNVLVNTYAINSIN